MTDEKTVITTVGTSIFTNYFDKDKNKYSNLNKDHYKKLKNKPFSEWKDWEDRINKFKSVISNWVKNNEDASAEIKSLVKIQEKLKARLKVILLTTDTILSNLDADLIRDYFKDSENIIIDEGHYNIKDLQVEDYKKFVEGRENLIGEIRKIVKKEFSKTKDWRKTIKSIAENYKFCISGGYKIIIPTITIIAQIYKMETFYVFENSNDLIETAIIPLGFDDFLLEKLYFSIDKLKNQGNYNYKDIDKDLMDKLKAANFIRNGKITELGELFYDYVQNNRELGRNVLGYFAEYKLYEYFILANKYKNIKHSYKKNRDAGELDFVLDNKIIVEVKPMSSFLHKDRMDKILKQIRKQIKYYPEYKEHHLYLYTSFKEAINESNINEQIHKLYSKLTDLEVKFKCFGVYWSFSKKEDNPYQTFMKRKLKEKDITEIKLEGGNHV